MAAMVGNGVPCQEPEQPQKKTLLHSRQLLSRHEARIGMQSRLISVLVRQLERHRDLMPCWVEQHKAVGMVAWRKEQELAHAGEEVKLWAQRMEEDALEAEEKLQLLVHGMLREQEKVESMCRDKQAELDKALEEERQERLILNAEEKKHAALSMSLERTLGQLNAVQAEMLAFKAAQADKQPGHKEERELKGLPPQEKQELAKECQDMRRQREVIAAEKGQVEFEIKRIQSEIDQHRSRTSRLEGFIDKITGVTAAGTPYMPDSAMRKEALGLVGRRGGRGAASRRPASAPPSSRHR
mmetsp:Transcript_33336/g.61116  ORF Transcript_33336/g.61116 Transcript_33336/m.61116 type:complete len:298 (-) Transcript_33336:149-1042(-)